MVEGAQEGNGVRSSGNSDGQAQPRFQERDIQMQQSVECWAHLANHKARGLGVELMGVRLPTKCVSFCESRPQLYFAEFAVYFPLKAHN